MKLRGPPRRRESIHIIALILLFGIYGIAILLSVGVSLSDYRGYDFYMDPKEHILKPGESISWSFFYPAGSPQLKPAFYEGKESTWALLEKIKVLDQSKLLQVPVMIKLNGHELFVTMLSPVKNSESFVGFDISSSQFYDYKSLNTVKIDNMGDVQISIASFSVQRCYRISLEVIMWIRVAPYILTIAIIGMLVYLLTSKPRK